MTVCDPDLLPPDLTAVGFQFVETNPVTGCHEYIHVGVGGGAGGQAATGMLFVLLPGGEFQMGSPGAEPDRDADEGPLHDVMLDPFLISKTEVSQAEYQAVMAGHATLSATPNRDPEGFRGSSVGFRPVGSLSAAFTFTVNNAQGFPEYTHTPTGIDFVLLPGGVFQMGSPPVEPDRDADEGPLHTVTLDSFLIAKREVSQAEYEAVMVGHATLSAIPNDGPLPPTSGDDLPVGFVSWEDLNDPDGFLARTGLELPTEAEWEYACRAGTAGPYAGSGNLDEMGWYNLTSGGMPQPVGTRLPNQFGLHDMHGNVWEWCEDDYDADFYSKPEATVPNPLSVGSGDRVIRGGSFSGAAGDCRSAYRIAGQSATAGDDLPVGFVSWNDLNDPDGFLARTGLLLPTEGQWEYACRAGQPGPISGTGNLVDMGWYELNEHPVLRHSGQPVGTLFPNQFGLHDMHGNVWEWCQDVYDAAFYTKPEASFPNPVATGSGDRVIRGGSWSGLASDCRSANRVGDPVDTHSAGLGFRLAASMTRLTVCDPNSPPPMLTGIGFQFFETNSRTGCHEYLHTGVGGDLGTDMRFVLLPGGEVQMGSPLTEAGRDVDEGPLDDVMLDSFLIAKTEVNQAEYEAVMTGHATLSATPNAGSDPPTSDDDLPVGFVSWDDLNDPDSFLARTGLRLPTEAQWEYACRAGTAGPYAGTGNIDEMGWYNLISGGMPQPVGTLAPNQFGLHDMHGNVWECCRDELGAYSLPVNPGDGSASLRAPRAGSSAAAASAAPPGTAVPPIASMSRWTPAVAAWASAPPRLCRNG
jgi:formylglycine-generating enzyme required for sulfatase activity